jgi:hypothetical protein
MMVVCAFSGRSQGGVLHEVIKGNEVLVPLKGSPDIDHLLQFILPVRSFALLL